MRRGERIGFSSVCRFKIPPNSVLYPLGPLSNHSWGWPSSGSRLCWHIKGGQEAVAVTVAGLAHGPSPWWCAHVWVSQLPRLVFPCSLAGSRDRLGVLLSAQGALGALHVPEGGRGLRVSVGQVPLQPVSAVCPWAWRQGRCALCQQLSPDRAGMDGNVQHIPRACGCAFPRSQGLGVTLEDPTCWEGALSSQTGPSVESFCSHTFLFPPPKPLQYELISMSILLREAVLVLGSPSWEATGAPGFL